MVIIPLVAFLGQAIQIHLQVFIQGLKLLLEGST